LQEAPVVFKTRDGMLAIQRNRAVRFVSAPRKTVPHDALPLSVVQNRTVSMCHVLFFAQRDYIR
jgi:hypothetical protein